MPSLNENLIQTNLDRKRTSMRFGFGSVDNVQGWTGVADQGSDKPVIFPVVPIYIYQQSKVTQIEQQSISGVRLVSEGKTDIASVNEILQHNYGYFSPAIKALKGKLFAMRDPSKHDDLLGGTGELPPGGTYEGTLAYRIKPNVQNNNKSYVVRIAFGSQESIPYKECYQDLINKELGRREALMRGLFIDNRFADRIERMVAYDPESYISITEFLPYVPVIDIPRSDRRKMSDSLFLDAEQTIHAMIDCGIQPDPLEENILINQQANTPHFVDYHSIKNWGFLSADSLTKLTQQNFIDLRFWLLNERSALRK